MSRRRGDSCLGGVVEKTQMSGGLRSSATQSQAPGPRPNPGANSPLGPALLAVLLASVALAGLSVAVAGRVTGGSMMAAEDRQGRDDSTQYWMRTRLPAAVPRVEGLSPFGAAPPGGFTAPAERDGLVATPVGFLDLKAPADVEKVLPPGLRRRAEVALPGARGRAGLATGLNLVQIEASAFASLGPAGVEAALSRHGRILRIVPERAFVVRLADGRAADALAREPFVEAAAPYHPGFKIDRLIGLMPLIQKRRAESRTLKLQVYGWNVLGDEELAAMRREVEEIAGRGAVSSEGDGRLLVVEVPTDAVARIAALDEVEVISEEPEWLQNAAEGVSLVMTGSVEETLGARPYCDIGLDGGGIDTNADGQRVNDGTDTVPPQIVAVTDNGLSLDTPSFAQTATQTYTLSNPIGPRHRKIQVIQQAGDTGDDCDALLWGSGSHGNVVAAVIAGNPSELGFYATKTTLPRNPLVSGIPLDGVARGARILVQDLANASRCTIDELVEQGGN